MSDGIDQLLFDYLLANARVIELQTISGVYFLFRGDEIVYIGQSYDVYSRVIDHKSDPSKHFDKWAYIEVDETERLEIERRYIEMFQPQYNQTHRIYPRRRYHQPKKTFGAVTVSGIKIYDDRRGSWEDQLDATHSLDAILRPAE